MSKKKFIVAIVLVLMLAWGWSIHLVEVLEITDKYPLYIESYTIGQIDYNVFWGIFWGIGLILSLYILFSLFKNEKVNKKINSDLVSLREDVDKIVDYLKSKEQKGEKE